MDNSREREREREGERERERERGRETERERCKFDQPSIKTLVYLGKEIHG